MASPGKLAVVTGANRGIGLALCRKLREKSYTVVGACRKRSTELDKLGVHVVEGVDVGRDGGCAPLTAALGSILQGGQRVDLLVANAGILREDVLADVQPEACTEQFEVNSLGPLRTYLAVKDVLARPAKIAIITSRMGSIADNGSGGDYGYRMSKAAVNMLGKTLAVDLRPQDISVGILHPGFVATDMTKQYHGAGGIIDASTSAAGLVRIIEEELRLESSGSFWHYSGSILPW